MTANSDRRAALEEIRMQRVQQSRFPNESLIFPSFPNLSHSTRLLASRL